MPEGHTLHRLALDHRKLFVGKVVSASSPQGRFAEGASVIDGCRVLAVEAYGKHLFYELEGDLIVHVHLGLFGRFRKRKGPDAPPRGAVRLRLATPKACVDLSGPTACEVVSAQDQAELLARLGPDLLRDDADPELAWDRIRRSKRSIGALLLDQSVLSGVGNVYRAEGLFVTGLHPETPGNTLTHEAFSSLWETLAAMLRDGVRDKRIVTTAHPEDGATRLRRGERTWVYKQAICKRCEEPVSCWELGARTMYACETCQQRA
jgi:endonuclease VIII